MKHLALIPCVFACATTAADLQPRIYDFAPHHLAELRMPANVASPKGQVIAMFVRQRDAIAACHLAGTYETDFSVELGLMTHVSVTPAAPCLEAALRAADVSLIAPDTAVRVTLPLVIDPGYAGAR